MLKELSIRIERENILGYIDLKLPEELIFKDAYTLLKSKNIFESIDINSYGILHMPVPPTPNDPEYSNQWHISHIKANQFWENFTTGSSSIKVAVLGEGVDHNHQDLSFWYQFGYDFIDMDFDPNPSPTSAARKHETVMAGLIAAKTNNGIAASGIAGGWNGNACQIIAVRTGNNGAAVISAIDDGIIYAADHGARVINMSFGLPDGNSAIDAAIEYAFYKKGCILIASAGNETVKATQLYYPGRHPLVLGIGGINEQNENNNQWTTGSDMFLVAPATNITSLTITSPGNLDATETHPNGGTSGAAAITSGAVALLLSEYPSLINHDVIKLLEDGATRLGTSTPDNTFGWGLLNINYSAVLYSFDEYLRSENVTLTGSVGQSPTIHWTLPSYSPADRFYVYRANSVDGRFKLYSIGTVYTSGSQTNYSYTDNTVTIQNKGASVIYYYRVKCVSNNGQSLYSDEVSCWSNSASKNSYNSTEGKTVSDYSVAQNSPNPFNPATSIEFSLKEPGHVKLSVYSILGEQVEILEDKMLTEGNYNYTFNGTNLPTGVYFYVFSYNDRTEINKMVLLK